MQSGGVVPRRQLRNGPKRTGEHNADLSQHHLIGDPSVNHRSSIINILAGPAQAFNS
jgi:hypothetical protein